MNARESGVAVDAVAALGMMSARPSMPSLNSQYIKQISKHHFNFHDGLCVFLYLLCWTF